MSKPRGEKEERKPVVQIDPTVTFYIITSRVWPVNTLFQTVSKAGFFRTQLEAIQEHL